MSDDTQKPVDEQDVSHETVEEEQPTQEEAPTQQSDAVGEGETNEEEDVGDAVDGDAEEENPITAAKAAFTFLRGWKDAQIEDWLRRCQNDRSPFISTNSDVLAYDPTRPKRKPKDWGTEEIKALIKGQLKHINLQAHQLHPFVDELRRRVPIEKAWSTQQVLDHYTKNLTPPKTSTGVWVTDRTRRERPASSWSNAELEAWAMGEIKPEGKASSVQLAQTLRERLSLPTEGTEVEEILASYRVNRSRDTAIATARAAQPSGELTKMNEAYISDTLQRYVEAVKPGKMVSETSGGKAQRILDAVFAYTLRLEGPKLKAGLDLIKRTVAENRHGAFSPSYAFRFVHQLKGDTRQRRRHTNFIRLFQICTDEDKSVKKQTDIPSMLADHPETLRPMLIDYFQNHC
jgi:hypothetical protein